MSEAAEKLIEIEDEFCLPQKPVKVTFEDVQKASLFVKKCIEPTPCTVSSLNKRQLKKVIVNCLEIKIVGGFGYDGVFQTRISSVYWKFQGTRC